MLPPAPCLQNCRKATEEKRYAWLEQNLGRLPEPNSAENINPARKEAFNRLADRSSKSNSFHPFQTCSNPNLLSHFKPPKSNAPKTKKPNAQPQGLPNHPPIRAHGVRRAKPPRRGGPKARGTWSGAPGFPWPKRKPGPEPGHMSYQEAPVGRKALLQEIGKFQDERKAP